MYFALSSYDMSMQYNMNNGKICRDHFYVNYIWMWNIFWYRDAVGLVLCLNRAILPEYWAFWITYVHKFDKLHKNALYLASCQIFTLTAIEFVLKLDPLEYQSIESLKNRKFPEMRFMQLPTVTFLLVSASSHPLHVSLFSLS